MTFEGDIMQKDNLSLMPWTRRGKDNKTFKLNLLHQVSFVYNCFKCFFFHWSIKQTVGLDKKWKDLREEMLPVGIIANHLLPTSKSCLKILFYLLCSWPGYKSSYKSLSRNQILKCIGQTWKWYVIFLMH